MMKEMKNDEAARLARALAMRGRSRQPAPIAWSIVFLGQGGGQSEPSAGMALETTSAITSSTSAISGARSGSGT